MYGISFGEENKIIYRYIYLGLIVLGSVSSLKFVISLIDLSYGIMAFPTILSALILAPRVDQMSKNILKIKIRQMFTNFYICIPIKIFL